MSTWEPGQPVLTAADHDAWLAWRAERRRQLQRQRRVRLRRIDYHAGRDAAAILSALWTPTPGGDFSTLLDRIVIEWATRHRKSLP